MIVCGFDQAPTGIAWAYGEPGSVPSRGYRENPDYGNNEILLGANVREWTSNHLKSCGAEAVFYEQIIIRREGINAQVTYDQFAVVMGINFAAFDAGLQHSTFMATIGKWRSWFHHGAHPSKGSSQTDVWKDMAMVECARRGWLITQDPKIAHNVAEACGIWDWGCQRLDATYRARAKRLTRRVEHERDEARRAAL
jgi:hypothetical protein